MRVLDVVAQIVGYGVLLAGAYYVVVAAVVGVATWVLRRWPRKAPPPISAEPATVRAICHRWQDTVPDGQGGKKLVFSCECAGVGCPFQPRPSVVHRAPAADDGGFTPCCGLTVFELSRSDRITVDREHVTCGWTQ